MCVSEREDPVQLTMRITGSSSAGMLFISSTLSPRPTSLTRPAHYQISPSISCYLALLRLPGLGCSLLLQLHPPSALWWRVPGKHRTLAWASTDYDSDGPRKRPFLPFKALSLPMTHKYIYTLRIIICIESQKQSLRSVFWCETRTWMGKDGAWKALKKKKTCQYSFFFASSSTDNRCVRLTLRALCDGTEYSFSSGSRLSTQHRRKQREKRAHEREKQRSMTHA